MPGLKPVAGLRLLLAGACAIMWISAAGPAIAQTYNNVCASISGLKCTVNPAPVGSPCGCFTPVGRVPGSVEGPSTEKRPGTTAVSPSTPDTASTKQTMSSVCQTKYGRCRIYPSPLKSQCQCGEDTGAVVEK
jgi:hypothetical protein